MILNDQKKSKENYFVTCENYMNSKFIVLLKIQLCLFIYVLFVSASALPQQNWVVAREIQWCFTGVWQPVLQSTLTNIIFLGSILTVCNIGEADSL